jgi:hypothetical protein
MRLNGRLFYVGIDYIHHSMNKIIHDTSNPCASFETLKEYKHFELIENVLKLCGFSGFTDYSTQSSLKDIKKMNKDNKLLNQINELLIANKMSELDAIDELFTFIRNNLSELNVPYEMIHKNSGNYLKLVQKKYTVENYLSTKSNLGPSKNITKYKDYIDFCNKNKVLRSVSDNHMLVDLIQSKMPGIIKKTIIKKLPIDIIYKSGDKYYIQSEIFKSYDVCKNFSCKLIQNGIVIDELNYELTYGQNVIINKQTDINMLAFRHYTIHINVEVPLDTCLEIINNSSQNDNNIYVEYDEVAYNSIPRNSLQNIKTYDSKDESKNYFRPNAKILPKDHIIFAANNKFILSYGKYSNLSYLDTKGNPIDEPVAIIQYVDLKEIKKTIKKDDILETDQYMNTLICLKPKHYVSYKIL